MALSRKILGALAIASVLATATPLSVANAAVTHPRPDQLRAGLVGDAQQVLVVSSTKWSATSASASLYDLEANHKSDHWERAREVVLKPNPGGFRANDAGPVWMGVLNDSWRMRGAGAILSAFKGGFIVNMLRSLMWDAKSGDAGFRAMMQDYVKQFTNRAAST